MAQRNAAGLLLLLLLASLCSPAFSAHTVRYAKIKSYGVWMHTVVVDLNSPDVVITPAVSRRGIGHSESFRSLIRRTKPAAAIDGTFFCTRSLKPTGDIVIDGRTVWKGYLGTALAVDGSGSISFVPTWKRGAYDPSIYQSVIAAGPALILNGRTIVMPKAEGFRSRVHFTRRVRAAVGLTYNNKLVMVVTTRPVQLRRLAYALKRLKCSDAACLDGGSSAGLYCKGKLRANPTRSMTNCILVYDNPWQYAKSKSRFSPLPAAGESRADKSKT